MKKLIAFIGFIAMFSLAADAQISSRVKGDTLTNADTVYITTDNQLDGLAGLQATVLKVGGTVAGHALLQGTIDGIAWVNVNTDTLTLTNVATQSKVWPITANGYKTYRIRYITTGTQVSVPYAAWIRRR